MKHAIVLLSAIFASAVVINAQQVVTFSTSGGYVTLEAKTLKGAPYSAETVNDSSQALADGNRIVQHTTGRVYRDGEGRVRREEDRASGSAGVSIVDPVAGVSYTLDPENHVAWKTSTGAGVMILQDALKKNAEAVQAEANALQFKVERGMVAAGAGGRVEFRRAGNSNEQRSEETLAPRQMEGVMVEGHRNTTTIPAGAIGNEQPITIVSEEWTSPGLRVLVMTDHKDPRTGESSYRLLNIVRGEPDGSLFQVPADYTIKETGVRRLEPTRQEDHD
jgi:hypothetical protein